MPRACFFCWINNGLVSLNYSSDSQKEHKFKPTLMFPTLHYHKIFLQNSCYRRIYLSILNNFDCTHYNFNTECANVPQRSLFLTLKHFCFFRMTLTCERSNAHSAVSLGLWRSPAASEQPRQKEWNLTVLECLKKWKKI